MIELNYLIISNFSPSEKYYSKTFNGKKMIGGTYRKSRFTEYTDISFITKKTRSQRENHLGILGPVIRAEVGDTVRIVLYNLSPKPVSVFLQGTSLKATQNGMWLKNPSS